MQTWNQIQFRLCLCRLFNYINWRLYLALDKMIIMYRKRRNEKEVVMTYIKELSCHSARGTEKNHETNFCYCWQSNNAMTMWGALVSSSILQIMIQTSPKYCHYLYNSSSPCTVMWCLLPTVISPSNTARLFSVFMEERPAVNSRMQWIQAASKTAISWLH
jgi:hypothetical protein